MTVPNPAYEGQLAERADLMLPDLDTDARLELLGVMNPDDLRASMAFIATMYPQAFDFALVRDEAMVDRLLERLDEAGQDADVLTPYCSACGAPVGIFRGHGEGWHHFRGNGTVETPNELYDAGHELVVAWRENTAGTAQ